MIFRIGFWLGVLLVAVFTAHWGAEQLTEPLKKLRQQWGLTAVAAATFVGIASASPEISINVVSAIRGVSDIGLGVMLGANVVAIPLVVTVAYIASRKSGLSESPSPNQSSKQSQANERNPYHRQHRQNRLLHVQRQAVWVLALPYLVILGIVVVLTLPAPWRGLQPIDSAILFGVYLIFLAQAVLRGRQGRESVDWTWKESSLAIVGVVVLAASAYVAVRATENIVAILGISKFVGGLFITGIVSATPEVFATWSVVRSREVTAGTTIVIGDTAVTMTLAFVPLGLVTVPIRNFQLFWVNLAFVALMPALYAALMHWGSREHGFKRWQVLTLDGSYLVYLCVMIFGVLNVI